MMSVYDQSVTYLFCLYLIWKWLSINISTRRDIGWFMAFNDTFNSISVIFWRSDLLVEETWVPGENHRLIVSHWQTLSHNVVSSVVSKEHMHHEYKQGRP
jgi:hypothetical protein